MAATPRIVSTTVTGPTQLYAILRDGTEFQVDLAGWIATGGEILAPLRDPRIFGTARPAEHGAAVAWAEDDDLMLDAVHLKLLTEEQRPFDRKELVNWQNQMAVSNREAASMLGVAVSTWNLYKTGKPIPHAVGMLVRATKRDPILMQAHYRPRPAAGRPRKTA